MQKNQKPDKLVRIKSDTNDILNEVKARIGVPKIRFVADAVSEKWAKMVKEPA